jgi:integrase
MTRRLKADHPALVKTRISLGAIVMATLYKRKDIWHISYVVNGQRFRVSTGTSDKKLALVKFNDLELKLFKKEIGAKEDAPKSASLAEFFKRYSEYYRTSHQGDIHGEVSRIKIMREFFARKRIKYIQEITPSVLEDFLSTVIPLHKPKTRKNYITLLKTVLNKAAEWKLIISNPIAEFKIPKTVKTFHFFGVEDIRLIISEAEEPLKTAIIILVNTGLRRAELYHLRWKDLDLVNGTLRVWPYSGFTPKGKRPRSIPISASLMETLIPLSKSPKTSGFVYRPYKNMNTLYHHFKHLLKRLGLSGTLHDLRHTFASHLSMAGVPIPVIKELMGHSDIATTMIYAHLSPSTYKEAISKLDFHV